MSNPVPKSRSFFESANYAIMGIVSSFRHERNFRIHFLTSIFVLLAGLRLGLTRQDMVMLLLAITFVFMSEMVNTSVELLTDAFVDRENPTAKLAKDVAAGGVLIAVVGAVCVGYVVFYDKIRTLTPEVFESVKAKPLHVAVVSLILVMILTIILKTLSSHGTPLMGGMPSGHSALAFATATVIFWFTRNPLVISAAFLLAVLVGQSRVQGKVHTFWEVVSGGVFGFSMVLLIFGIFLR